MKSRVIIVFLGIMGLWTLLIARAVFLQILPNSRLVNLKERQFKTVVTLQARRGSILDRNKRELAMSSKAYSLYADPHILSHHKSLARRLSKELGVSSDSIYLKIKDSKKRFVWIQRLLKEEQMKRIKGWGLQGLSFVEEWKRVYPNESLFAHSLGFLGQDGQALEGLERVLDKELVGNNKKVLVKRDARGRPLSADGLIFAENPDGNDVSLTIDSDLQYELESELQEAVNEFEAESAFGIILEAKTSEILAMASYPTFDPNKPMQINPELRRNRVLSDIIEPGSTFKTFVVASALRAGTLKPNKKYNCENGFFKVGDRIIREADSRHQFGDLTASEILAYSSNIGTTKIAFELGADRLYKGIMDFGFGSKQGIDLPGEAKGLFHPLPWRPHLLANISFGHGIGTTPLQIANAYAAIANGGILRPPTIIKSVFNSETGQTKDFSLPEGVKVLSKEEASIMRIMLTRVTQQDGTGANAKVAGFMVGGKTGTAQVVNPKGKGYLKGAYLSSFAGFLPANDPKFVIYVGVSQPKKAYYGSQVAAPIFSKVASYAVRKEGLVPSILSKEQLVNINPSQVSETLSQNQVKEDGLVPDLKNLSLREAIHRARDLNIKLKIHGEGFVSRLLPESGTQIPDDRKVQVYLE